MAKKLKSITVCNHKGGVGKTMITINLAHSLAEAGKKVLVIDLDDQANLSDYFLENIPPAEATTAYHIFLYDETKAEDVIRKTDYENIDIIPSNLILKEIVTKVRADIFIRPKNFIEREKLREKYDFLLFDTPPSLDIRVQAALLAARNVLPVITPDTWSLDGTKEILELVRFIEKNFHSEKRVLGVIVNKTKPQTVIAKSVEEQVPEILGIDVIKPLIPFSVVIPEHVVQKIPLQRLGKRAEKLLEVMRKISEEVARRAAPD